MSDVPSGPCQHAPTRLLAGVLYCEPCFQIAFRALGERLARQQAAHLRPVLPQRRPARRRVTRS